MIPPPIESAKLCCMDVILAVRPAHGCTCRPQEFRVEEFFFGRWVKGIFARSACHAFLFSRSPLAAVFDFCWCRSIVDSGRSGIPPTTAGSSRRGSLCNSRRGFGPGPSIPRGSWMSEAGVADRLWQTNTAAGTGRDAARRISQQSPAQHACCCGGGARRRPSGRLQRRVRPPMRLFPDSCRPPSRWTCQQS